MTVRTTENLPPRGLLDHIKSFRKHVEILIVQDHTTANMVQIAMPTMGVQQARKMAEFAGQDATTDAVKKEGETREVVD